MSFNPLQIELVLQKVFENLPKEDWKNFRLVNKLWRDASLDRWRKSMPFRIVYEQTEGKSGMEKFLNLFDGLEASANELQPFLQFNDKPFCRFYLDDKIITIPPYQVFVYGDDKAVSKEFDPRISYFFERCGPNIESLEIMPNVQFWKNGLLQGMKWIFRKCPKLRRITVLPDFSEMDGPVDQEGNNFSLEETAANVTSLRLILYWFNCPSSLDQHTLSDLFNLIPNLEALEVTRQTVVPTLSALRHPLRRGGYIQLRKLNLPIIDEELFELLREYISIAKPHLSELTLKIHKQRGIWNPPSSLPFNGFMADIGETLTKLTLCFKEWDEDVLWVNLLTGHHFPKVTYLGICCFSEIHKARMNGLIRFDFRCLTGFPKLQTFCSLGYGNNTSKKYCRLIKKLFYFNGKLDWNNAKPDMRRVPLKDLKEFRFQYPEIFNPDCLKILAQWMPSVERLSIVCNKEIFVILMDIWPLDKLTLLPGSSVSEAMIKRREEAVTLITIEDMVAGGKVVVYSDYDFV